MLINGQLFETRAAEQQLAPQRGRREEERESLSGKKGEVGGCAFREITNKYSMCTKGGWFRRL